MEITDFAAALRGMADNADVLAKRHDVADMARLRRQVADQAVDSQRDADLIDELRRQAAGMGRSLDAIARLRGTDIRSAVTIFGDALMLLAGPCANYIPDSWTCRTEGVSRTRGARPGTAAWCVQCVARDALERAGVGVEDGETK